MSTNKHNSANLRYAGKPLTNRILASLDEAGFDELMPSLELINFSSGDCLYQAGENTGYVYFPETVVVSHFYNGEDGNAVEIAMVGCEGATGLCAVLGFPQPAIHQAIITIEGSAWRVETGTLRQEISRGGKLQALIMSYANNYLAEVSQRVVCQSFHPVEKRLCSWLLMLHDRVKANQLTMKQDRMSQFLGVNRPSISLVAKNLRDEGLIDYASGSFYIMDREGLEATACACYAAVHSAIKVDHLSDSSGGYYP